jgi:hypothetical protein
VILYDIHLPLSLPFPGSDSRDEMYYDSVLSCHWGFLIHIAIEIPACLSFYLFPSRQLGTYTPYAHPVIRQYAVLLFATVLVAMVFLRHPIDETSGKVAGALAVYHIAPSLRSIERLTRQSRTRQLTFLSEAALYLLVHVLCCATLLHHAWRALYCGLPS